LILGVCSLLSVLLVSVVCWMSLVGWLVVVCLLVVVCDCRMEEQNQREGTVWNSGFIYSMDICIISFSLVLV
jgi:heme/copper-type cytochrome/quinol oxidase subunit 2